MNQSLVGLFIIFWVCFYLCIICRKPGGLANEARKAKGRMIKTGKITYGAGKILTKMFLK